jgi:hypothetical protein
MRRVYRWAVEGAAALMRLSPKICPVNDVVIAKRAPRGFISRVCDTMERGALARLPSYGEAVVFDA